MDNVVIRCIEDLSRAWGVPEGSLESAICEETFFGVIVIIKDSCIEAMVKQGEKEERRQSLYFPFTMAEVNAFLSAIDQEAKSLLLKTGKRDCGILDPYCASGMNDTYMELVMQEPTFVSVDIWTEQTHWKWEEVQKIFMEDSFGTNMKEDEV